LVFRRRTPENLKRVEQAPATKTVAVTFWMAGDHFMVAWGGINGKRVFFFVDTGGAGVGTKLAEFAIKEADIHLEEDKAVEGVGGGGKLRSVPYVVKDLALGAAHERNVPGVFEGPFPWEWTFGFRLAGLISHSFFRPYALTFDFEGMQLLLQRKP
jgi:hypothetical protein